MAKKKTSTEAEDTSKSIRARADFPHTFYRVTDPTHPCYSESVHDVPPRDFIKNIQDHGVIEPIECKEYVIDGVTQRCIVVGRSRQRGAEIGFQELLDAGLTLPGGPDAPSSEGRIPYILSNHLTDQEVRDHIAAENAFRKIPSLKENIATAINYYKQEQAAAAKGRRKFDEAATKRRIAAVHRVDLKTLAFWFEVDKLPDEARARVLSGEVPISSVGVLLKTSPEQHPDVISRIKGAGALTTREVNEAASDVPQADRAPSGPRDRSQPRGAKDRKGDKKLYAPRGPKLETGIKLVQARLDELTAKIAPIEDDDQDWADGFDQLKEIQAQTVAATRDFLAFARGEPIEWLAPPPAKAARKQSPPKAPKTPRAPKADKPARAGRATPEEREAKKERKAQEKIEARRTNAIVNQRAGRVELRTREGQAAYLEHMREAVRSRISSWATADLLKIVGGTANSVRAYLEQLEGAGEVQRSGNGRSLRWTAVTEPMYASAENSEEDSDDSEDPAGDSEADGADRHVELDDDDQPRLFEP